MNVLVPDGVAPGIRGSRAPSYLGGREQPGNDRRAMKAAVTRQQSEEEWFEMKVIGMLALSITAFGRLAPARSLSQTTLKIKFERNMEDK